MALITSAGIGSGLDLESIISASVNAERAPKLQAITKREDSLKVELSSIGEITSAVSKLKDTLAKLADANNYNKRTATIKQPTTGDLISVTTSNKMSPGNFNIEVVRLAQGSRGVSGSFTNASQVVSATGGNLSFAAGPDKNFTLAVTAGMTLNELKDAINSNTNNFGVTANIINTGDPIQGTKLVFTSKITGDANNLVVSNDNSELDSVSTVATGAGPAGITIAAADMAKNAIIKVDGLEISNATNTFTDSVQDLTIRALRVGAVGESAKLTVDNDRESVTKLVDELIANYNNLIGTVGLQTRVGRPLNGDPSIRAMSNQIFNTLASKITGAGPFETVFDLGIGVKKDGYLERSSLVRSLNDAMDTNYDSIDNVFAGDNGIATQLNKMLENYIGSSGLLKKRTDNINSNIKDAGEDKINLGVRMQDLEASLRKKYAGLDVLLAQMRQTQSALGAQLASLPGFTRNSS